MAGRPPATAGLAALPRYASLFVVLLLTSRAVAAADVCIAHAVPTAVLRAALAVQCRCSRDRWEQWLPVKRLAPITLGTKASWVPSQRLRGRASQASAAVPCSGNEEEQGQQLELMRLHA
jgi:hypothetical protein